MSAASERYCLAHLASYIALHPLSWHISIRSIQQSARVGVDNVNTPYTNAGLRGDDQVVGIADAGIDRSSCYFNDSMGNVPLSELRSPVNISTIKPYIRRILHWNATTSSGSSLAEIEQLINNVKIFRRS